MQKTVWWKCEISIQLTGHRVFKHLTFLYIKNTGWGIKTGNHTHAETTMSELGAWLAPEITRSLA